MDWSQFLSTVFSIIGFIIMLPFIGGVLLLGFGAIMFALKVICGIIDFVLKLFHIETTLEQSIMKLIERLFDFIESIPSLLRKIWKWIKISFLVLVVFCMFAFLIFLCFDRCYGNSSSNYHDEEEIEDIMEDPMRHVPSRYQ